MVRTHPPHGQTEVRFELTAVLVLLSLRSDHSTTISIADPSVRCGDASWEERQLLTLATLSNDASLRVMSARYSEHCSQCRPEHLSDFRLSLQKLHFGTLRREAHQPRQPSNLRIQIRGGHWFVAAPSIIYSTFVMKTARHYDGHRTAR